MNKKNEIERILRKRLKAIADRERRKKRFDNARIVADEKIQNTIVTESLFRCPACHKMTGSELKHTGNIQRVMGCDIDKGGCGITWPYWEEVNKMKPSNKRPSFKGV